MSFEILSFEGIFGDFSTEVSFMISGMGSNHERSKLAPVLEDCIGLPLHCQTEFQLQKQAAAPTGIIHKTVKGSKRESVRPLCLLVMLQDAYVRMMYDMADKGDVSAVICLMSYHGVGVPDYPHHATFGSKTTTDYDDCRHASDLFKFECHTQTQVAKPCDNSECYTLSYHVYKATLETTLDMDQCEHNQR